MATLLAVGVLAAVVELTVSSANARSTHGVGRVGAHDKTTGEPVTTFRRSNRRYREAMRYHPGLDRDKDGIACEKR